MLEGGVKVKTNLIVLSLVAVLIASTASTQVVVPPPTPIKKPTTIVPAKIETKGGKLVVVDASRAKGDVLFDWDHALDSAMVDGKKLFISVPKADEPRTYSVTVISWDDRTRDVVKIEAAGDRTPVVDPPTNDPVLQRLDKIEKRLSALEQAKPPGPEVTTIVRHFTFVGAEETPSARAVANDAKLREMLKSAKVDVHVVSKSELKSQSAGFIRTVESGGGPPMLVLQDEDGRIINHEGITTVSAAMELASKHIRR